MPRSLVVSSRAPRLWAQALSAAIIVMAGACSEATSPVALPSNRVGSPEAASLITVAPTGIETAAGTERSPWTLEKAATSAPAGATVQLLSGTYHTSKLDITRPLTIRPAPGATVVLSGSAGSPVGMIVHAAGTRITGLRFEHFSESGLRVSTNNVQVDHNTFSYNGQIGLDINGVANVTVEYNTITYNGRVGIEASHSSNITVQNNNISNNNTGNYNMSWAAGGIKITSSNYFTVRNNWVADNRANGLWVDAGTTNTTIAGNQVMRNKAYGIYFELSNTALIVGNFSHDNGQGGIGVHFTSNARIYNNTLVNNGTDLDVSASYNRLPYDLSHATIVNNLMWNSTTRLMMNLYRASGCNSWVYSQVDYNGYYRPSGSPAWYEVNWCNSWYTSLWSFHRGTGYEAHALQIDGGGDPFFVSVRNGDYRLHSGSPAIKRGQALPWDVASALGVKSGVPVNMGAAQ